jgi:dephospho-CoA kinase
MLVIGLTGGIGSGKSTVADIFASFGVPIIDADVLAREVVERGQAALAEIAEQFGAGVLDVTGRLDRAQLRTRVFSDPHARRRLEGILHPRIREKMDRYTHQYRAAGYPYCIKVIPLLVETRQVAKVDRVLVVDLDEETQVQRVMARDGGSRQAAKAILASQAERAERLKTADDIIENTISREKLELKVADLHQQYQAMAQQRDCD